MRLKLILTILLIFIHATTLLSGCTTNSAVTIHGKIAIKGNEPHTFLALTTEQGEEYQLQGPLVEQIKQQNQGMILELSGTILSTKKVFALPIMFRVQEIK